MTNYPIDEISKIVKAEATIHHPACNVSYLLTDSRKLVYPDSTLFIALVTSNRNGHQFIPELYQKGVHNFLVSEPMDALQFPDANFLKVPDTLPALQSLAASHRKRFRIPVIGITGSNGKTIVKEWLFQLLNEDYNIVRSPRSYNSQIGVPLSVWQMEPENTLAIIEAGISQPGEMANLEKIIQPTIGIFTNIGDAHNEGFLNILQKIREKLLLFIHSKVLIYCKDYPNLHESILQFHGQMHRVENSDEKPLGLFTWSQKTDADLRILKIHAAEENGTGWDKNSRYTHLEGLFKGKAVNIKIPFTDQGSIENAIHCWCVMLLLQTEESVIRERMQQLSSIAMRLELKQAVNDCSIINDSYNSDFNSLSIALDFLSQQKQHRKKTLILSDILQSGRSNGDLYEEVAGLLKQKGITRLIGIGKNISKEKNIFSKNKKLSASFYPDTASFISGFQSNTHSDGNLSFHDETILLKGSRVFEFEHISHLLEQKTHQTVLEINLNALANNLKVYRSLLKPNVKMMVMVKAFSYGSGSYEIANLLQFYRADYLAVAYGDEGVALRKKGITLPIMVMNPEPNAFQSIIQWNLEPEIYSFRLLALFTEEINARKKNNYPVHIKLDTGMHRLGFGPEHITLLVEQLKHNESVKVISVFSHLAASDEPALKDFTMEQARRFEEMSSQMMENLSYPFLRHLANSSAISGYPELQYDMVRLGIGMYGIDHSQKIQQKLEVVSTLKTTISQLRKVQAGETVGYGRMGKVDTDKIIATIPIGYADGFQRTLGNGNGKLLVHGALAPVIGNICMDMLMADVTPIANVKEGDPVIVFGKEPTIQEVAQWAGTIPYEMMTGISQRVKRIYVQE